MKKIVVIFAFTLIACGSNKGSDATLQKVSQVRGNKPGDKFMIFWAKFKDVVRRKDTAAFRALSFDTVISIHDTISIQQFIGNQFMNLFDDTLLVRMSDEKRVAFIPDTDLDPGILVSPMMYKSEAGKYMGQKVAIEKYFKASEGLEFHDFTFVETPNEYKFLIYDLFGGVNRK